MRSTASSANAFLPCGNAPHRANWPTGAAICRAAAVGRILEKLAEDEQIRVFGQKLSREANLHDLLRRPNLDYAALMTLEGARSSENLSAEVIEQVEIQVKYQGYIDRQNEEIDSRRDIETLKLPDDIDYSKVKGLSAEVQQKLNQHKPETVGQASRISGVTPAAVALLMVHLKRGFKEVK